MVLIYNVIQTKVLNILYVIIFATPAVHITKTTRF